MKTPVMTMVKYSPQRLRNNRPVPSVNRTDSVEKCSDTKFCQLFWADREDPCEHPVDVSIIRIHPQDVNPMRYQSSHIAMNQFKQSDSYGCQQKTLQQLVGA